MKTRSQRKRFMSSMLFAAMMIANQPAHAQFNKYRSQTRFNPDKGETPPPRMDETAAPEVETMSAEDAAAALKAAEKLERDADEAAAAESPDEDSAAL